MPTALTKSNAKLKFEKKRSVLMVNIEADYSNYTNAKDKNILVTCYDVEKHKTRKPCEYTVSHSNLTHPKKMFSCPDCKKHYISIKNRLSIDEVNEYVVHWSLTNDYHVATKTGFVEVYSGNMEKIPFVCNNGNLNYKTLVDIQAGDKCGCDECRSQLTTKQYEKLREQKANIFDTIESKKLWFNSKLIYSWLTDDMLKMLGYDQIDVYVQKLKSLQYTFVGLEIKDFSKFKGLLNCPVILEHEGVYYRSSKMSHVLSGNYNYRVEYDKNNLEYYFYHLSTNANKIHLIPKKTNIGSKVHIPYIYKKCGHESSAMVGVLMNSDIVECTICNPYQGEAVCLSLDIDPIFEHFDVIKEKRFEDCKFKNTLPYDRYVNDLNLLLEYDGKQHFDINSVWYTDDGVKRDQIKTEYAINNGYNFIRIAYYEDHVEALESFLALVLKHSDKQIVQIYGEVQILDKN